MEDNKFKKAVERQMQRDKAKSSRRVRNEVAQRFQLVRRLQGALCISPVTYIDLGKVKKKTRPLGLCVCVTCGACDHYKKMDGGHFQSRDRPFTMLMPENVNPQCKYCNDQKGLSGNYAMYRQWIDETVDKYVLIRRLVNATGNEQEAEVHEGSSPSELMIRLSNIPSPHTAETIAVARIQTNSFIRKLTAQLDEKVAEHGTKHDGTGHETNWTA